MQVAASALVLSSGAICITQGSYQSASPAIANDVDYNILLVAVSPIGCHQASLDHCIRVVCIDMDDWSAHGLANVRGIWTGSTLCWRGSEAQLIVQDDMYGTACCEACWRQE